MFSNKINISFSNNYQTETSCIVILINENLTLDKIALEIDNKYNKIISKIIGDKNLFNNKFNATKLLTVQDNGEIKYILLIGLGKNSELTEYSFEKIGGKIFSILKENKISSSNIIVDQTVDKIDSPIASSLIANGIILASYSFDKYITAKEDEQFNIKEIIIVNSFPERSLKLLEINSSIAEGIFFAKDCITEPANIIYPESYANRIIEVFNLPNLRVEVLGKIEMQKLGMGALLGVAQGSANEPKLVIMKYKGTNEENFPVALVGKGVTFDTGGISLKPNKNMGDMKYDMAGSAAVAGVVLALAKRNAKVNVVGVIGLVENMPSGFAQRPGDVVKTMSGKTAEVIDTDAEGRLVLADAIWYAEETFKPQILIDLATLTGAVSIALGTTYAGLFSNDDDLALKLQNAGDKVDEKLWRLPLHKDYDQMIKSSIADISNLGNVPGKASSSTAAQFLQHFVKEGVKWAHLDIAGMAWISQSKEICPKGAVGFGIRLLNKFIKDNYESENY